MGAVNKAGESEPSPETKPHLCRHKNLAPSIDKGQAGSKTVRVGRTAFWQIRCKGEPPSGLHLGSPCPWQPQLLRGFHCDDGGVPGRVHHHPCRSTMLRTQTRALTHSRRRTEME